MAQKGNDLVQYITERVLRYIKTPREIRIEKRRQRRQMETWVRRWFGFIPFSLGMWLKKRNRKR